MLVDYLVYPSPGVEIPIEKQGTKEYLDTGFEIWGWGS